MTETFAEGWTETQQNIADRRPDGAVVRDMAMQTAADMAGTPILDRIYPVSGGPAAGGTTVGLHGAGLTGATGVTIGAVAATGFKVISDTEVICTSGAHAAGAVDVVLLHPAGNQTLVGGFTYV